MTNMNQQTNDNRQNLDRFAINLVGKAQAGKLDPVVGRDDEIRREIGRAHV